MPREYESLYVGPLSAHLGFQLLSLSSSQMESLLLSARCHGSSSSHHWFFGLESLVWGWDPSPFGGREITAPEISLLIGPPHVSVGPAQFASLPVLPILGWLLLYILSYRTSIWLVFTWFSRLIVL